MTHPSDPVADAGTDQPVGAWDRALRVALLRGHVDGVREALANGAVANGCLVDGTSVLNALIEFGNVGLVEQALAQGARVNDVDSLDRGALTSLHHAVWHDHPAIVRVLLAHGADPAATAFSGNDPCTTCHGSSPLHLAAERAGPAVIALLLDADPSQVLVGDAYGRTPLHLTMRHPNARLVELDRKEARAVTLLLEHGANPDAMARTYVDGSQGATPLHDAAHQALPQAAQRLLDAGADPNVLNDRGETALAIALQRGSAAHPVVAVLERWALAQALPEDSGRTRREATARL